MDSQSRSRSSFPTPQTPLSTYAREPVLSAPPMQWKNTGRLPLSQNRRTFLAIASLPSGRNISLYARDELWTNLTDGPSGDAFMSAISLCVRKSRSVLIPSVSVMYRTSSAVSRLRPADSPFTLSSLRACPLNATPRRMRRPSVVRHPPRSLTFATRPSSAIHLGAASAVVNDHVSDAVAGPVLPQAQPFGLTVLPHSHSEQRVAPQTRHQ